MSKTTFKDGPFDGMEVDKPPPVQRKRTHAIAWRLPDEHQPDKPLDQGGLGYVRHAVYLWMASDQRYAWVDFVDANSPEMLKRALDVVEGKGPMVGFGG